MSFKKKMHNRGITKLDNLVETPSYIGEEKPIKTRFNWLNIAIPVAAGLVVLAVPLSIALAGGFNAKSASKVNEDNYSGAGDIHNGSTTQNDSDGINEGSIIKDLSFSQLLDYEGVSNNISIEVYNYGEGGFVTLAHTFSDESVTNIVNSLNTVESNYDSLVGQMDSSSTSRNASGHLMGINHKIVFKSGDNKLVAQYYSQFHSLSTYKSSFDINGSVAYTILDEFVEMDYDSTFDETILH